MGRGGGKLPLPLLLAVKMRFQFCLRNVPRCLTDNGFESSLVQLGMGGNSKRLFRTVRETANNLNVAAFLSGYGKAEQREYLDVLTGKSFQLRHGRAN